MGKSRSEIQRAYRERQKQKGPEFLSKERARQRQYYVPAAKLPKRRLDERNQTNKLRNRLSRLRKWERQQREESSSVIESSGYDSMLSPNTDDEQEPSNDEPMPSTSGISTNQIAKQKVAVTTDDEPLPSIDEMLPSTSGISNEENVPPKLIIKLPSIPRSKGRPFKKQRSRTLSTANRKIKKLEKNIKTYQTKIKSKNKRIERLKKKQQKQVLPVTPKSKTDLEVSELNLTPSSRTKVRKKLLAFNALQAEIKEAKSMTSSKKVNNIHRVVSGRIVKRYRCINTISESTALCRHAMSRSISNTKEIRVDAEKRNCLSRIFEESVSNFLCRDDNSRMNPGKSDAKKTADGQKKQTRVLTDYLKNLHLKYQSEFPEQKISLTTFQRLRPRNVLLSKFLSRVSCQCIYHQNMALKIQALRKIGFKISENPENVITHYEEFVDSLEASLPDKIRFQIWKKVDDGKGKLKLRLVEEEETKTDFKNGLITQLARFRKHVDRLRTQFNQMKKLKENLPENEMIVQMDFAENFTCRKQNEVQSYYWCQTMVTLHPVVTYFKKSGQLEHKSYVIVSDEMSHSASTVCCFLDKLIPELKSVNPEISKIHYWTDSPSSQYRNRFILSAVATHTDVYGIMATWNYFETGHGKSACDGVGGTIKRMADTAIRQEKAQIDTARDFADWGSKDMTTVKFVFVDKKDTQAKKEEMSLTHINSIKGTMTLHAVCATESHHTILTRETSCYCPTCLSGKYCDTWKKITFGTAPKISEPVDAPQQNTIVESKDGKTQKDMPQNLFATVDQGSFVAAVYADKWYIGKILTKDGTDNDCEISFMQAAKTMFKWPASPDKVWVKSSQLLCEIPKPNPSGKSGRMFMIDHETHTKIRECFASFKE